MLHMQFKLHMVLHYQNKTFNLHNKVLLPVQMLQICWQKPRPKFNNANEEVNYDTQSNLILLLSRLSDTDL